MSINLEDYKEDYVRSALSIIQKMNEILDTPDFKKNKDLVEELHRSAHSLKGQALAMGFNQIGMTGKSLEMLFLKVTESEIRIDENFSETVREALNELQNAINHISSGNAEKNLEDVIQKIETIS